MACGASWSHGPKPLTFVHISKKQAVPGASANQQNADVGELTFLPDSCLTSTVETTYIDTGNTLRLRCEKSAMRRHKATCTADEI